jgi:hypothetical protein
VSFLLLHLFLDSSKLMAIAAAVGYGGGAAFVHQKRILEGLFAKEVGEFRTNQPPPYVCAVD